MNFENLKEQFLHPQDVSDMFTAEDIEKNKVVGALACVPFLFWLPLVAAKESGFAKFYANQGLLELILSIAVSVVTVILAFIPFIGGLLGTIVSLVPTAAFLFLIINAFQGKARRLPVIGEMIEAFK